jgi:hypothetical protein
MADLLAVATHYEVESSRQKRVATAGSAPAAAGRHDPAMTENCYTETVFGGTA